MLDRYTDRDLAVSVVWFNMVRTDERSRWPSDEIVDARARHYWDDGKVVGRAVAARAELASWGPVAWDAWLLYPPGVTWETDAPLPASYGRTILKSRQQLVEALRALPTGPQS